MHGASYDAATTDPWEQYRVPPPSPAHTPSTARVSKTALEHKTALADGRGTFASLAAAAAREASARAPVASLASEWMPEVNGEWRNCSCELLGRLRSDGLLTLRDRARARAAAAAAAPAAAGNARAPSTSPPTSRPGASAEEVLQELYLHARVREAEEAKRRDGRARAERQARAALAALPAAEVAAACEKGFDGFEEALETTLGVGTWARAIGAVPDKWEEEEALDAFADLLRHPQTSQHLWLLLESTSDTK